MDWIEASARMAGTAQYPRRGRRHHRSRCRVPTQSAQFAAALGRRNSCQPPKRTHRRMRGIIGSLTAGRSVRVISGRARGVAQLELQAGAGAGESACGAGPWEAWYYKSPQPAPHFPAGFPGLCRGRHATAFLACAASCSAPFSFLQSHGSRHRARTSIARCGLELVRTTNGRSPNFCWTSSGAADDRTSLTAPAKGDAS
jgi:hypothetical protein